MTKALHSWLKKDINTLLISDRQNGGCVEEQRQKQSLKVTSDNNKQSAFIQTELLNSLTVEGMNDLLNTLFCSAERRACCCSYSSEQRCHRGSMSYLRCPAWEHPAESTLLLITDTLPDQLMQLVTVPQDHTVQSFNISATFSLSYIFEYSPLSTLYVWSRFGTSLAGEQNFRQQGL